MDDLISREELLETPWVLPNIMTRKQALECFWNIVSEAEAVDAVPAVRCRECKKRKTAACPMRVYCINIYHVEKLVDMTRDDGFCDRGIRRGDNAAD